MSGFVSSINANRRSHHVVSPNNNNATKKTTSDTPKILPIEPLSQSRVEQIDHSIQRAFLITDVLEAVIQIAAKYQKPISKKDIRSLMQELVDSEIENSMEFKNEMYYDIDFGRLEMQGILKTISKLNKSLYDQVLNYLRNRSQRVSDEYQEQLVRAEAQKEDSLASFLDNTIATKGFLARIESHYKPDMAEILEEVYANVYNIFEIMGVGSATSGSDWSFVDPKENPYMKMDTGFVDSIIWHHLLYDEFPLGTIRWMLETPKHQRKSLQFETVLSFYVGNVLLERYTLEYDLHNLYCRILHGSKRVGHFKINIRGRHIVQANGDIFNKRVLMHYFEKKRHLKAKRVVLGEWRSGCLESVLHHERGRWVTPDQDPKQMTFRCKSAQSGKGEFVFTRDGRIGEDIISETFIFNKNSQVPLFGFGIIQNRDRPKMLPIHLYPPIQYVTN